MLLSQRLCLSAAAALATLVPGALRAQDAFQSSLPEGTSLYIGAADIPSAMEGFKSSALYKIWQSEETQEFLADLMAMAEQQYAQAMAQAKAMHEQGMLPVPPEKLAELRLKAFHFAVTDLQMPTQENPMPRIGVVLSLDFGDSAGTVQQLMNAMLPMMMAQMGPNAPQPQESEVAGSKLMTMQLPDVPPFITFNWGWSGSQLLLGTDTARLSSIMTALKDGGDGGFLGSQLYRTTDSKIGGRPAAFEMYMDMGILMDRVMAGLGMAAAMSPNPDVDFAGIQRAIEASGLRGIKGVGMRTGWENGKAFIDSFMMMPEKERKGLSQFIAGAKPVDRAHLAWVPRDVSSFSVGSMPMMSVLYDSIMDAVKAYDPNIGQMAESQMGMLKENLGLDVPALLGTMGGEMMVYQRPVTGLMAAPEMVISMGCPQPDVMLGQMKKLMALSEGMVDIAESKEGDQSVYGINITMPGGGFDPSAIIDPAFAFSKGQMVFALNRTDLRTALQRMNGTAEGEDITKHPEFAKYMEQLPEGATAIGFADMKATFEGLYGALTSVIGFAEIPANIPVDLGLLPTAETITDPLFGQVNWSVTDADGVVSRMVGPMGPEYLGLGLAAGLGLGVMAIQEEMGAMPIRRR